ncbi:MAG: hypothetical protein EHM93_14400 [Bacteroidales bacterium]|nr:MAG: hypothetical protein EHM93_14400 [Bacteroidales bacterium]
MEASLWYLDIKVLRIIYELYDSIYKDWVLFSDFKLRDLPSIEKYLNFAYNTKPENLLTEIYIPIEG